MTYPEISDFAEGQTQKLQCFSTWQFFSALPAQILKPCNVRCAHSSAFGYGWRPTPMSLRVAEDPMREFPNFSWFGTHRSVLPCKSPCGSSGRMVFFLGFSWSGKCDSNGGKPQRLHSNRLPPACCPFCQADRHRLSGQNGNGLKSCGSHMGLSAICFANRDKSPSEASRSDEGALRIGVFQQ